MYSRNITLANTRGNSGAPPNSRRHQESPERIPVKSFVDSSAYEHFGNIGRDTLREPQRTEEAIEKKLPEVKTKEEPEEASVDGTPLVGNTHEPDISANVNESSETARKRESIGITEYVKPTLSSLLNVIDTDIIILTAAAALIYFGRGSERNTLTPLALIAIAFL